MKPLPNRTSRGFTLIELGAMLCIGCIFTAMILPTLPRARSRCRCQKVNCVNNLKQIGMSFRTWALDNNEKYPAQVSVTNGGTIELVGTGVAYNHFLVMSNELSTPKVLVCPADTRRRSATTFASNIPRNVHGQLPFTNDVSLSYFVGVDADSSEPTRILIGDRNLLVNGKLLKHGPALVSTNCAVGWSRSMHVQHGNIGLADGSVTQANESYLRRLFQNTGLAVNRLEVP